MAHFAKAIFVVGSKRTAIGAFGGKLKDLTPVDLQYAASNAALIAANVKPDHVDHVVIGNVHSLVSVDSRNLARRVLLKCGIPEHVPAFVVNRLCGSGFQALVSGAYEIAAGDSNIVLTGGSENMSMIPHIAHVRTGAKLGVDVKLVDYLWDSLTNHPAMGLTAENLAEKYGITRLQSEQFALQSQTKWEQANKAGYFKEEIVPINLKVKGEDVVFDVDEPPRKTSLELLAKLKPVFKKDGTVTAGTASGISDGAAAVLIASSDAVKQHNLKPLARLVGFAVVGVDPNIMGIGPAPAIRKLLNKVNLKLDDIDLIEVNEAFAPQYLAVEKELGLNPEKCNVNGGAVAMGHPLGCSGSRICGHLIHELRRRGGKYAIGSACIGGGQGIAVLFENVK